MEVIEDPVEIRRAIDRLHRRVARRDDYGHLLARGDVIRRVDADLDVAQWRTEIRRQARADRIRVRSGLGNGIVWAIRLDSNIELLTAEGDRYTAALEQLVPSAVAMRHEPIVVVCDGDEAVLGCKRCAAKAYVHAGEGVCGGDLLDDQCPNGDDSQETALTFLRGERPSGS